MLKIVYRICCGMDVHKSFVVACVASTNEQGVTTYKSKRFSTFTGDLHRCAAWLAENNCKDVCMESTGKYWIPVYNILEQTCNIVLAHPKYVKAIRGIQTLESKWPTGTCLEMFPDYVWENALELLFGRISQRRSQAVTVTVPTHLKIGDTA